MFDLSVPGALCIDLLSLTPPLQLPFLRDLYQPADEIAEDVLETYKDNIHEEAVSPTPVVLDKAGGEAGGRGMEEAVEIEGERRGGTEEEQRSHDRGEIPGAGVEQEAVVPRRVSVFVLASNHISSLSLPLLDISLPPVWPQTSSNRSWSPVTS